MTKKIKSKKQKNLIKLDILFIIGCILYTFLTFDLSFLNEIFGFIKVYNYDILVIINVFLAYFWVFIFIFLSKCAFAIAIYLGFRFTRMKILKDNSKYQVIDNIQYYRERFNNITPAEISLLTDLEIERKKDITASLLSLYEKGIIDFENQNIIVKNLDNKNLRNSELILIEMINNNSFNSSNIYDWEKKCIEEAIENNYIKEKSKSKKKLRFIKNNIVIIISIILLVLSVNWGNKFLNSDNGKLWINKVESIESTITNLEELENNVEIKQLYGEAISESGPFLLSFSVMIVSVFIIILNPIYRISRRIAHVINRKNNRYERTDEGKILIEQIMGIKNYIHDFSLLSDKEKESIILWKDFLIYAVVLEENSNIIEDIYKYKNINSNIFSKIINSIDVENEVK